MALDLGAAPLKGPVPKKRAPARQYEGNRLTQDVGAFAFRTGTGAPVIEWAAKQVGKDVNTWIGSGISKLILGDKAGVYDIRFINLIIKPFGEIKRIAGKSARNFAWDVIQGARRQKFANEWVKYFNDNPDCIWQLKEWEYNDLNNFLSAKKDGNFLQKAFKGRHSQLKNPTDHYIKRFGELEARGYVRTGQAKRFKEILEGAHRWEDLRDILNFTNEIASGKWKERFFWRKSFVPARASRYARFKKQAETTWKYLKKLGKPLNWLTGNGVKLLKNAGSWALRGAGQLASSIFTGGGLGGLGGGAAVGAGTATGIAVPAGAALAEGAAFTAVAGGSITAGLEGATIIAGGEAISLAAGEALGFGAGTSITIFSGSASVGGAGLVAAEEIATGIATAGAKPLIEITAGLFIAGVVIAIVVIIIFISSIFTSNPGASEVVAGFPVGPPPPGGQFGNGRGCEEKGLYPIGGSSSHACYHWDGYRPVDIFADEGTPVVAPLDGVSYLYDNYLGGRAVVLHPNDECQPALYFAHNRAEGRVGGSVTKGEVIALVSDTGYRAKGRDPHVHFAASTNGRFYSKSLDVCSVELLSDWGDPQSTVCVKPCCNLDKPNRNGCTPP